MNQRTRPRHNYASTNNTAYIGVDEFMTYQSRHRWNEVRPFMAQTEWDDEDSIQAPAKPNYAMMDLMCGHMADNPSMMCEVTNPETFVHWNEHSWLDRINNPDAWAEEALRKCATKDDSYQGSLDKVIEFCDSMHTEEFRVTFEPEPTLYIAPGPSVMNAVKHFRLCGHYELVPLIAKCDKRGVEELLYRLVEEECERVEAQKGKANE